MEEPLKILKSEAILLALIPALGTVAHFCFEAGYLNHFGAPVRLVDSTIPGILLSSTFVALYGCFIFFYVTLVFSLLYLRSPLAASVALSLMYGIIAVPFVVVAPTNVMMWISFGGLILLGLVNHLIIPLCGWKKEGSVKNALAKNLEREVEQSEHKKLRTSRDWISLSTALLFFGSLFAFGVGGHMAETQKEFHVVESDPKLLFLRRYNDSFMFVRISDTTPLRPETIEVREIGDAGLVLKKKKVGKIKNVNKP